MACLKRHIWKLVEYINWLFDPKANVHSRKNQMEDPGTCITTEIIHQKQYYILGGISEISANFIYLQNARVLIPIIISLNHMIGL